jgi:hypothetical protein
LRIKPISLPYCEIPSQYQPEESLPFHFIGITLHRPTSSLGDEVRLEHIAQGAPGGANSWLRGF